MNSAFKAIADSFRYSVREKIWNKMLEMKKTTPNLFSDEELIKLAEEKNFDDDATINDLYEKIIRTLHNELFK
jgi:hypothetical protein